MNKILAIGGTVVVAAITGFCIGYVGSELYHKYHKKKQTKKKENTIVPEVKSVTKEMFDKLYSLAGVDQEYDEAWANGTGYLNGLVEQNDKIPRVKIRVFRSIDTDGRRIINTPWGVIFERYNDGSEVYVCHEHGNRTRNPIFFKEDYEDVMTLLRNI